MIGGGRNQKPVDTILKLPSILKTRGWLNPTITADYTIVTSKYKASERDSEG
jgi:hypothetical protein